MIIVTDLDDTLEDLLPAWVTWLNNKYNLNVCYKDIIDWDMKKFFPELTSEQIYEPLNYPQFWDHVFPKQQAVNVVNRLIEEGHTIKICTATDYRCVQIKYEKIIKRYFPNIKWKDVIVAYDKSLIKADVFIDDNPRNLERNDCVCLLMNAPHNTSYEGIAKRVDNWEEIYACIKKLTI